MRIVYLLESAALWGGVKAVLEDANALTARGHSVRVLCKTARPDWMSLSCDFATVTDFTPDEIGNPDVVVGTFWTTVPATLHARAGAAVHYCQGYEGEHVSWRAHRAAIEAVYRLPTFKIVIAPHLRRTLGRLGVEARVITYCIDHSVMHPARPRPASPSFRVGLVGPYQVSWKGIAFGFRACELARSAGLPLQLVRATNTAPHADELRSPVPIEWHHRVPPRRMGDVYRSMDVFLTTSLGDEEGFFLPAVEAMACGVPGVFTDIPCTRDYGEGDYALFVAPSDPMQMAEAIVALVHRPELRAAVRREGLRIAARFTASRHLDELEAAFADAVAGGPRIEATDRPSRARSGGLRVRAETLA
jgi:glycosyltransferase involved in cell wall biosynthesis